MSRPYARAWCLVLLLAVTGTQLAQCGMPQHLARRLQQTTDGNTALQSPPADSPMPVDSPVNAPDNPMDSPIPTATDSTGMPSPATDGESQMPSPSPPPESSPESSPAPTSAVPPRIEINEISKRPETDRYRNLLILAWQSMQQMDYNDPLSYYQLAAIHGAPYVTYNNSVGAATPKSGYCFHGSVLFNTWHRPYLLYFERSMIQQAQKVAASFVNEAERCLYQDVAPTLRLPYWDWANPYNSKATEFPTIITDARIRVVNPADPNLRIRVIDNPFYQYRLPVAITDKRPWPVSIPKGRATVRDPSNSGKLVSASRNDFVKAVQADATSLATRVYNLLGSRDWECQLATQGSESCSAGVAQLESTHSTLHGTVGGTMAWVEVAAYDPLFWLHHAQADRIFWLWQQRWPTVWVPSHTEVGNYFLPINSTVDATTPLAPFWRDSEGYYTSNDVRDIEALGYTYQPPPGGDPKRGPRISASTVSLLPVQQGEGVKQVAQADAMAGDVQGDLTWGKQGFGDIAGFFTRRRLMLANSSHGISALQQHDRHWEQAMHLYGRGYHGYRWQLRFVGSGEHQLGLPFFIRVFTAKQYKEHALVERSVASELPGYCGSYYEFSAKHTAAGMRTPVVIDVTECMMRSGMQTSFTPKLVGSLATGPSGVPSNAKDFVWTATTHDGTDVSKMFAPPKLIWSVLAEDGELRVGSV